MNREDIIRMAREAGCDEIHATKVLTGLHFRPESLERFFHMAQALEREVCAKLVHDNALACDPGSMLQVYLASNAAAIRARDKA